MARDERGAVMTRLDLFKKWLEDQGANPRDFKITNGDMEEDAHHCYGFVCPDDVSALAEDNGEYIVDCMECKYNQFWTKEVEDGKID